MEKGTIYRSSHGDFVVLKYTNKHNVYIEFMNTKHKKLTTRAEIFSGKIKDETYPEANGVGYLGVGEYKFGQKPYYDAWLKVCSNCTPEWHNFQVFSEWYRSNYIDDMHLSRVNVFEPYGPDNCIFTTRKEAGNAKEYHLINPDGETISIVNLSELCREHNLNYSAMMQVVNGDRGTHKGWKSPGRKVTPVREKEYVFAHMEDEPVVIHNLSQFCRRNGLNYSCMLAVKAGRIKSHKGWWTNPKLENSVLGVPMAPVIIPIGSPQLNDLSGTYPEVPSGMSPTVRIEAKKQPPLPPVPKR